MRLGVSRAGAGVRLRRLKPGAGPGTGGPGRGLGAAGGAVRRRASERAGVAPPLAGAGRGEVDNGHRRSGGRKGGEGAGSRYSLVI